MNSAVPPPFRADLSYFSPSMSHCVRVPFIFFKKRSLLAVVESRKFFLCVPYFTPTSISFGFPLNCLQNPSDCWLFNRFPSVLETTIVHGHWLSTISSQLSVFFMVLTDLYWFESSIFIAKYIKKTWIWELFPYLGSSVIIDPKFYIVPFDFSTKVPPFYFAEFRRGRSSVRSIVRFTGYFFMGSTEFYWVIVGPLSFCDGHGHRRMTFWWTRLFLCLPCPLPLPPRLLASLAILSLLLSSYPTCEAHFSQWSRDFTAFTEFYWVFIPRSQSLKEPLDCETAFNFLKAISIR